MIRYAEDIGISDDQDGPERADDEQQLLVILSVNPSLLMRFASHFDTKKVPTAFLYFKVVKGNASGQVY
jgi:hypothetical protein